MTGKNARPPFSPDPTEDAHAQPPRIPADAPPPAAVDEDDALVAAPVVPFAAEVDPADPPAEAVVLDADEADDDAVDEVAEDVLVGGHISGAAIVGSAPRKRPVGKRDAGVSPRRVAPPPMYALAESEAANDGSSTAGAATTLPSAATLADVSGIPADSGSAHASSTRSASVS